MTIFSFYFIEHFICKYAYLGNTCRLPRCQDLNLRTSCFVFLASWPGQVIESLITRFANSTGIITLSSSFFGQFEQSGTVFPSQVPVVLLSCFCKFPNLWVPFNCIALLMFFINLTFFLKMTWFAKTLGSASFDLKSVARFFTRQLWLFLFTFLVVSSVYTLLYLYI